jgi:hypothetical protein
VHVSQGFLGALGLQDDKARLQAQLSQAAAGGSASEARLADLTASIEQLREEGESLSRKAGEQEAALRKVRAAYVAATVLSAWQQGDLRSSHRQRRAPLPAHSRPAICGATGSVDRRVRR